MFYVGVSLLCISVVLIAIAIYAVNRIVTVQKMILELTRIQCEDVFQILKNTQFIYDAVDSIRFAQDTKLRRGTEND